MAGEQAKQQTNPFVKDSYLKVKDAGEIELDTLTKINPSQMFDIPQILTNRAKKVFSKHNIHEIRHWSGLLTDHYHLLHAMEKPMNLDYTRQFANTDDLVSDTPEVVAKAAEEA